MPAFETRKEEDAILVGLITNRLRRKEAQENLAELARLAETAAVRVRHAILQERDRIDAATFVGTGKAAEIGTLVDSEQIDLVIFDDDLSPVQVRNLERSIKCKIIDRSGLILDIFASRAKSKEAMTQIELAQLQYLLPRLTRQWTHLSKQYGGVGTKGPGEQQIETDRRAVRARISHLKRKLDRIALEREVQRKGRNILPRVAMVGYTNAGKSTLLHLLSGAEVLIEDKLFATLDTTVRQVMLSAYKKILLSDTVGFIRKLPPHLIASFRSTLAEVAEADILLHIVDVTHPRFRDQMAVVKSTLEELGAAEKPTIVVFNKIDQLADRTILRDLAAEYPRSAAISAERSINISRLIEALLDLIDSDAAEQTITVKQSEYRTIARLREIADIVDQTYVDNAVTVRFRVGKKNMERLKKLLGHRIAEVEKS